MGSDPICLHATSWNTWLSLTHIFHSQAKVSVDALTLKAQDGCYPKGTVVPMKIHLTVKPYNAAAFASMKKILITTTDRDEYVKGQTVNNEAKEKIKNEKNNK